MSADRRRFLACCVGAALLPLPGCAALASVSAPVTGGQLRLIPRNYPGLDGPAGFLQVQPEGWDLPLYVLRDGLGDLSALSPVCTHLGCVVEVEGSSLVCPCHGSTYARNGAVMRGPAERALRRFPTVVEADGTLVIDVSGGPR